MIGTLAANVQVLENGEAVARSAVTAFWEVIASSASDRIAVCLSGGATPKRLYEVLQEDSSRIPWDRIHWFWGDERFVPITDEHSNAGMAWRALLAYAPQPLHTAHFMALPTKAAEQSAFLYEEELKRYYGADQLQPDRPLFDLVLMGLGEDGHTASLFPASPALDQRKRWVTSVEKAGQPPFVSRVTLTLPALESAREMLFLVSGAAKQNALARVLAGDDLPAARVRPVGRLRWLVDRAAAPENMS